MSGKIEQGEQGELYLYDPLKYAPASADELVILVRELIECRKYLTKHPRSKKALNKFSTLEDQFETMLDYVKVNHEFIAEYLDMAESDLCRAEAQVKQGNAAANEQLNTLFLSQNTGIIYSNLGDFYSDSDDENLNSEAKEAHFKALGHFKFCLDSVALKGSHDLLKDYAWSVIQYFENEDYENIENDDMLTELKVLILNYIDNFDNKSDLFDDLARINVLMADYFNSKSATGGEDMITLDDSQKRYIKTLYDDAVRYAKKALLYSPPDDNSAETTFIDVNLQYARCLFRFGEVKEANILLQDLLKRFKTLDAKVEIARQLFTAYGVDSRPVLEMAKHLLKQVAEFETGTVDAHYLLGRIALAEHTFNIEETIEKIELAIKNILALDPGDKDNLARDLSEGMAGLKSAMFAARVNRVFDHEGAN